MSNENTTPEISEQDGERQWFESLDIVQTDDWQELPYWITEDVQYTMYAPCIDSVRNVGFIRTSDGERLWLNELNSANRKRVERLLKRLDHYREQGAHGYMCQFVSGIFSANLYGQAQDGYIIVGSYGVSSEVELYDESGNPSGQYHYEDGYLLIGAPIDR